jgi:hypothetical protein
MDGLVNSDLTHLKKKVMNTEPALLTPILCHDGVYRVIKRKYRMHTRRSFYS